MKNRRKNTDKPSLGVRFIFAVFDILTFGAITTARWRIENEDRLNNQYKKSK